MSLMEVLYSSFAILLVLLTARLSLQRKLDSLITHTLSK